MGCCKSSSGAANSTTPSNNPLATDPNLPKAPDGTVLGQDGSRGGTVPFYGSIGGAYVSPTNPGGPYTANGTQHATGLNYKPSTPKSIDPSRGALSAKYESHKDPSAIGFDTTGGASYGTYQIATKTGTMNNFLKYEQVNNPTAYDNLMAAGGGSYEGQNSQEFQNAWKSEVANNSSFSTDQDGFVQSTHYDVAASRIQNLTGIDVNNRSMAVQQVVWSTSCMNGPYSSVYQKAFAGKDTSNMSDADIINSLMDERSKTTANGSLAYYTSSPRNIQNAVSNRLVDERKTALAELS